MKHAIKHIHFVGIGGAGMSGIAEVLLNLGYASAVPICPTAPRSAPGALGIRTHVGHAAPTWPMPTRWSPPPRCSPDNPEVIGAGAQAHSGGAAGSDAG
jgi:UDP-N-acetylmuramate--alanine ligase